MGHRDAELRHNFLKGFRLGQASVEACGEPFPQVAWHGTISGDAPDPQLMPSTELKLLVAPPSADLRAFDQRRRGERLRLKAVASDSRFRAGQAPSGQAMAGLIE